MNESRSFLFRLEAGLSLIELMIALAIGSLLVLGLVQVFGASRSAYQMSEGMARVQENARFAVDFLQRDIRMAGHFGCVNDQAHYVKEAGDPTVHLAGFTPGQGDPEDFSVSIQGYEATGTNPGQTATVGSATGSWNPDLPSTVSALEPLPGSDIIVLRYLGARGTPVTSIEAAELTIPSGGSSDGWSVLTDEGVAAPTLFGISDCSHADVFSGSGQTGSVLAEPAVASSLSERYNPHPAGQTQLYRANSIVYYVAEGVNGPALHRARYNDGAYTTEELVEGVENLQFLFGMDQVEDISAENPPTGNITEHATANTLGTDPEQWRRVGLVQVGMLVSSPDRAAAPAPSDETADPYVLGVRFEAAASHDAHYRAVYESTVALRNRLFGN